MSDLPRSVRIARALAKRLMEMGWENVWVIPVGPRNWTARGEVAGELYSVTSATPDGALYQLQTHALEVAEEGL